MNFAAVKDKAKALFEEASFISEIRNEADYENALALMDELIEDYDENRTLIGVLANSIETWENTAPEFEAFNQRIAQLDDGVAVLRTLIDQYQLKADDLKNEIGSKSLVSMILNGSRNLTREHIQALSLRFGLNPAVFFQMPGHRLQLVS
ncbi:MAG: transcriptional regulator [Gammaproteobacteria bacterium]|nr:transcriptional regulator [Gammaproteobacteria bacterium]